MAKWGEGDPRWIVEERPDAVNVNNWHWTEKNAMAWSKDKLKSLLLDCSLNNSVGECKITEVEKCEGDASANNRKAKLIVFYEWDLKLKYKGKVYGSEDNELSGSIKIPNLSDENTVDDLDIQFRPDGSAKEDLRMKEALRHEGVKILKTQLQKYITALNEEFTQGMILPKKDGSSERTTEKLTKISSGFDKSSVSSKGVLKKTQDLTTSATMQCTAREVYNALTKQELFSVFTNGSGRIEERVGGSFEMFGGNVHGKILELIENEKIVQEWRFKSWPPAHFSTVTFTFKQEKTSTVVTLHQKGVPEEDLEKTKEGWERYYWDAMKRTLGFGSFIQ